MQIKKRLQIYVAISVLTAFAICLVLFLSLLNLNKANNSEIIADEIITSVLERVTLRNDYIRNNSLRAKEQWLAKHEQIGILLKSAVKSFQNAEDRKNIAELIEDHESIGKIFFAIVANREKSGLNSGSAVLSHEVEERLLNQLNMRVYEVVIHARELLESSRQARASALRLAGWGVISILLIIIAAAMTNARLMGRAITDRVGRLRDGAAVIGSGDLDHRIDIKGDDEFAELSGAFNAMTVKLSGSHHDLEYEIRERRRAEEALRKANEGLEACVEERTQELKAANEAVNLERRRLYGVLETLPVYVVLLTQDYHVPFANRFFRERFGESGERLCYEFLRNRSKPCEISETFGSLKTNAPHHWEWAGPDGHDYDIYDYPFVDSDGSPLILEMGIDTTERKQAVKALKDLNETLEERIIERTAQLNSANETLRASRVAALNLMEDAITARNEAEETSNKLMLENAERNRAELELQKIAQQRQHALDAAHMGWWHYDPITRISSWDDGYKEIFGITGYQCPNEDILSSIHPEDLPGVWAKVEAALDPVNPQPYLAEYRINLPEGSMRWIEAYGIASFEGIGENRRATSFVGTVADISERKRAEEERQTSVDFLRLVNESRNSADLIRAATVFFHGKSGCEAVGIRLREGDDYPYFEAHGFSEEFVLLENHLCDYNGSGEVIRDSAGDPVIECMCGNVICGRFDPSKPFFTNNGSFWTNCTSELLASTTEADRQARTRNRCNGEGYESVALIPIRLGDERLGLLQLNDRQQWRFSPTTIALWERLTGYLSVALTKLRAEEAIARRNALLTGINSIFKEALTCETDEELAWACLKVGEALTGSRFGFISEIGADGFLHDTAISETGWDACAQYDRTGNRRPPGNFHIHGVYGRVLLDGKSFFTNDPASHPDSIGVPEGHPPLTAFLGVPLQSGGKTIGMIALGNRDGGYREEDLESLEALAPAIVEVFQRKRAEEALRTSYQQTNLLAETTAQLLASDSPQRVVDELCRKVMKVLDCQAFFNFLVDEKAGRLRLNACAGIPEEEMKKLEWLDYGIAVCGCAARDAIRIVAEDIPNTPDPRTELAKSYGIRAYACHPLLAQGRVLGTLSFGTCNRSSFTEDELTLMKTVADHVAIAMERKLAEEDLKLAREAAEAASRAKSQFLANMSHELRTPMTGVLGMLEFTLDGPLEVQQRDFIETAHNSALALLRILNDILDLAKVEAGKLSLEERPFVLRDCVSGAVDILVPEARRKGLELNCTMADDLPKAVVGDHVRLKQVLTNLLGNAVKYTKRGEVKITVTPGPKAPAGKSEINFIVMDTGIGIPAEKKEMIFQSFTQADESHTRRYGGVGLGLAISKDLVEQMGGTISCVSEEGVGSTFSFTLPLAEAMPTGEAAAKTVTPALPISEPPLTEEYRKARLLIAEDDPITRQVIGMMLKHSNFDHDIAENGLQAVEIWEKGNYDLVLMDVQMPGLDGFAATGAIREKERAMGGHTLIVAMTAHAFPEDEKRCLAAGMDAYIPKPIDMKKCIAMIEELILKRAHEAL